MTYNHTITNIRQNNFFGFGELSVGVQVKQHENEDRFLVSDYETSDFYGFNTTYLTRWPVEIFSDLFFHF